MMKKMLLLLGVAGALSACAQPQGVGLGPMGSDVSDLPQNTRTEFEMAGLTPLPIYRFSFAAAATPADALNAGGNRLRQAEQNLEIVQESRTYFMRQVELNDNIYVVSEGDAPVASLVSVIRARTGCLVDPRPLRSEDAAVYTLDCS
jgi:hypothetical protein